jgi:hypothetical protein
MLKISLIFAICFSICSFAIEKPKWVDDVSKGCTKKEICAQGEGTNREAASLNANLAISKILDNKIESKFTSKIESENSKLSESINEEIKQVTASALSGVEINKFYEEGEKVYALAVLDKTKAAKTIKKEIDSIDEKMLALSKDSESSSKVKLEGLYLKRELLERKHNFFTGADLPSPLKYEDVFNSKKDATKNMIVHVYLDEDEPKLVEQALAKEISGLGYKVTRGQVRHTDSTHIVTGEVLADKEYMQVEGFEKYNFHAKISAMNAKRVGTGEFQYSVTESGRNFSQASDKAMPKIKEEIKEKIVDLKID